MKISGIVLILSLISCVQPFEIKLPDSNQTLVISGLLTDQNGPHHVSISYAKAIDADSVDYVSEATVWVEDGNGNVTPYTETEPGRYDSPSSFCGSAGEKYSLFVEYLNRTYQSTSVQMPDPISIDSIYGTYNEVINENANEVREGIQFFVDIYENSDNPLYFRYSWKSVFNFFSPCGSSTCFYHDDSQTIIVASTEGQIIHNLVNAPIKFVTSGGLSGRSDKYAIQLSQYRIDKQTYDFYKDLKKINESGGSLFDPQKGSLYGNVTAIDSDEKVLGIFEVSSYSERVSFFSLINIDNRMRGKYPERCTCPPSPPLNPDPPGCYDCRFLGYTEPRPEWWRE